VGDRPYETLVRLDEPDPDGWLHVRITLDWPNEVVPQILAIGPDCELLEPLELRERITSQALRLASRYASLPDVGLDRDATSDARAHEAPAVPA
jgi:predicted DNA-binding transcriptional regulator YafY